MISKQKETSIGDESTVFVKTVMRVYQRKKLKQQEVGKIMIAIYSSVFRGQRCCSTTMPCMRR